MASLFRAPVRLVAHGIVALVPVALLAAACAATTEAVPGADSDASPHGDAGTGSNDAADGPGRTCELTRAYFEGCGNEDDLMCGRSAFDAWCVANDESMNSEAYRRAEARCLTQDNCDGKKRRACEYAHYDGETPTASQRALVAAYCETCEAADVAGCAERSTTFDPTKGIESVPDIFVAAWELADAIVDEMKTACTGAAASDAGADAAACAKAFAGCAADVYLTRLPDCPER